MEISVIITAGGMGKRMGAKEPKQFLNLCGIPILQRSIKQFYHYDHDIQILLTLPEEWIAHWNELCKKHDFRISHSIVKGGEERYDSIKNALQEVKGDIILVHDGVRPLIDETLIRKVVDSVKGNGGVVPAVPLTSSLRKGTKENNSAQDRSLYWEVQTPQGFSTDTLKKAYLTPFSEKITDDASLVEETGGKIEIIEGSFENIKITRPIDILIAEKILQC